MTCYSYSRIGTFEKCPYKYKLQYIDKVKVEVPTTIEAFMGSLVHKTLEKLYNDKKFKKMVAKNSLLKYYKDLWERDFSDDILIVKKGLKGDNYKKMGIKFISDYYDKYKPFEDMTILGLETDGRITLPNGDQYSIRIDKFGYINDVYYVCDYKTSNKMKEQEEADSDRQLAMYSFWVKDKFPDAKKVVLKWYMLAFNKEVVSERTDKQLKELQEEIVETIKRIESCKEFKTNVTKLCDYCKFKSICPSFRHEVGLEKKNIKEFKEDEGVKLVDEYSEIKTKLMELKKQEEEFKKELIEYAKQFNVDVVYGSNKRASVKPYDKLIYPEDKTELIEMIKEKGLYETFSSINYFKLTPKIIKGEVDKDIAGLTSKGRDYRISLSKRKERGA